MSAKQVGRSPSKRRTGGGSCEWYTPPDVIARVRYALAGRIDFDPASCEAANQTVGADRFLSAQDDALNPLTAWGGPALFVNPPYAGALIAGFAMRLIGEIAAGNVAAAIWLSNAMTETKAGQMILAAARLLHFPIGRIAFIDGTTGRAVNNSPTGSMIAGLGAVDVDRFRAAFGKHGAILQGADCPPQVQAGL